MTSGGFLNAGFRSGPKDNNFGGNVGPPPHGSWQHVQRTSGQGHEILFNFHSHDVHVIACFDTGDPDPCHPAGEADSIVFGGEGDYAIGNGPRDHHAYWFGVVADNGEPGRRGNQNGGCGYPDYYAIFVYSDPGMQNLVFTAAGVLDGGNLQVRDCRNGSQDLKFMSAVTKYWRDYYVAMLENGGVVPKDELSSDIESLDLFKPIPNPFTGTTRMAYAVSGPSTERVEISVFNVSGQRVRSIVSGTKAPGRYEAIWDGHDENGNQVPAGVYFYRASIGSQNTVSRVVLVR